MPSYTAAVSVDTDQELDTLDLALLEREVTACLSHLGVVTVNIEWEDEGVTDGPRTGGTESDSDPDDPDDPIDPDPEEVP